MSDNGTYLDKLTRRLQWLTSGKYNTDIYQDLMRYEKLEIEVKQLCGFNFECLKELFAMGFTLKPPEYELSLNQIIKLAEINKEIKL